MIMEATFAVNEKVFCGNAEQHKFISTLRKNLLSGFAMQGSLSG
jgi:hypothetical protein